MKKLLIATLAAITLSACTNEGKTYDVLRKAGYTDIKVGGWAPFSCSEDDVFKTKFTATNPTGQTVEGVVCAGWFKGGTIRL